MAIAIKQIPILKGEIAENFIKKAEENFEQRHTIDFSKQIADAQKILAKAKL